MLVNPIYKQTFENITINKLFTYVKSKKKLKRKINVEKGIAP
jgi:hypothetical protein